MNEFVSTRLISVVSQRRRAKSLTARRPSDPPHGAAPIGRSDHSFLTNERHFSRVSGTRGHEAGILDAAPKTTRRY